MLPKWKGVGGHICQKRRLRAFPTVPVNCWGAQLPWASLWGTAQPVLWGPSVSQTSGQTPTVPTCAVLSLLKYKRFSTIITERLIPSRQYWPCKEESWSPSPPGAHCSHASVTLASTSSHTEMNWAWNMWGNGLFAWRTGQRSYLQGVSCNVVPVFQNSAWRVCWGGMDSHPAHFICCSQPLQSPLHLSLASALTVLGLAVASPLCQMCRRAGE